MERNELGRILFETCHITGHFILSTNIVSNEYYDKYLFELDPKLLSEVANHLAPLVSPNTQLLAGLELGGVIIATAVSLRTGIQAVVVRKEVKKYGLNKIIEGPPVAGKKVSMIEDITTSGSQIIKAAKRIVYAGGDLREVLCVIEREPRARINLLREKLVLKPLFTAVELKTLASPCTRRYVASQGDAL